ncbi:hypothetical protein F511_31218 [Dorcoceras hygrometricum]|uniref:Dystroglycan-like n=1 Tax=Dorcoceras hygrometricum TaxID=472368 RepID=A0A2Z7C120_9LAMI|nr:hypothetical protein F511_31218 [Dorcoceras hygrometricum]
MASSLYSNAQHVDFDSVLAMDDPGMVSMFEALEAFGLRGFLGCPAVVYEDALVDFFENASVRNGVVFSTVGGQIVKISEELFAESFELPVEGLGDLSEIPKDAIFDARSIVSLSGEQINLSGRKNQMKMPYRLLCDIVAKAISVKAGSFNAITVEKFSLMTAVVCGVKMNWAKFLFGILKKMVAVKTKQAKGFAIQISLLLATFPAVDLVAAKKKDVSKKRTAADIEAVVPKKKRTSKKKSISSISSLEMVAVAEEALVVEPLDVEEPRCSSADAVDLIIQQVLDETRADEAPADTTEPAVNVEKNWFDLSYEDIVKQWEAERPVVTPSDTDDEDVATADVAPADEVQQGGDVVAPISAEEELSADETTKNQMKMPYRLLCDIVAKAISVKAGSFNAITVEKFSLMTAVVCGVKMNWAKFLFGILKKMVAVKTKQAKGFAIQISLLLATFPAVDLGEASAFPASKILSKKTVLRFVSINDRDGAEEITVAAKKKDVSKKRTAADIEAVVPKKKRTSKKKSISSISSLEMVAVAEEALVVEPLDVEEPRCSSADAVDLIIQQVLDETRADEAPADTTEPAVTEEKNWFDLPYEDIVKQWEAERPVVTASDTEDDDVATAVVAPADRIQQVEDFEAPLSAEVELSEDEKTSLDDILLSIPVDIPLPSTCMEVTQIKMGQMIKIPGVTKWTWFLKKLPRIPADDKGKELLVEKDPVRGNPAKEHYSLICADIELLVNLRAQAIDEVASFFRSFSLRKLSSINFEEMYSKEEQVLRWGETESPQIAIQRKFYILLKYRTILVWKFLKAWRINFAPGQGSTAVDIQVIELLSALHLSLLEELAKEARTLGLTWTKPCCSSVVEGSPRDRGAVIARSNSSTRSLCWIRRMFLVEGAWKVEQCADMWVKIPKKVVSAEVPLQRQYDDTLPTMSVFFKLMRKRWADVCLEAVEFCVQRLLPVDSIRSYRSLQLSASVSSFDSRRPTVFELRVSQFCSVFVNLSLFNRISSAEITEFLSAIALEKTVLRGVQCSQDSFSVAPRVQLT